MQAKLNGTTILLLGTGRSGTTWLASLLSLPFRYRLLFEPFQPHRVAGMERIADCYYRPSNIPSQVSDRCYQAINDEIDSNWIAQSSSRRFRMHRWRFWPRVRICKDVRTNLFVPTYRTIFGHALPILAVIRRPESVVESFLRVKFPWAFDIDQLLAQADFQSDYGIPLDKLARYRESEVGRLMVRWVIENAYLLQNYQELGVKIIYYEDYKQDPVSKIRRLCKELNIQASNKLEDEAYKPSYTTHPRSPLRNASEPEKRQSKFSLEDQAVIDEIKQVVNINYPF